MEKAERTISIVTPSFNQAEFLERTIRSVLDQRHPNLEYVVADGGSTDGSGEIIRRYADRLAWWVSEPDGGQYDAIDKGFAHTSGEIMAWINSDDMYLPWAFSVVAELFAAFPEIEWLTTLTPAWFDEHDRVVMVQPVGQFGYTRKGFFRGETLIERGRFAKFFIQQESTFWRRPLWERAGGHISTDYSLAGDFELWARFYRHAELYAVTTPLAGYRSHERQKTHSGMDVYVAQGKEILRQHGGRLHGRFSSLLREIGVRLPQRISVPLGLHYRPLHILHNERAPGWTIQGR